MLEWSSSSTPLELVPSTTHNKESSSVPLGHFESDARCAANVVSQLLANFQYRQPLDDCGRWGGARNLSIPLAGLVRRYATIDVNGNACCTNFQPENPQQQIGSAAYQTLRRS
jgi:hypothetical protein